jgi:hypothetical protein
MARSGLGRHFQDVLPYRLRSRQQSIKIVRDR